MNDQFKNSHQVRRVTNFKDLVSTPFAAEVNAICWLRHLAGDFSEIVKKLRLVENVTVLEEQDLLDLHLSEQGQLARETILNDLNLLKAEGASPVLNLIRRYDRDAAATFFPTDVYSFHVDRSPVPTNTFLCTYHGAASDILPNAQAEQKILVPEIRSQLRKIHSGKEEDFDAFLTEHFFDLHYRPKPGAVPISLGLGHLWRLAVDHPQSAVLPCVHRAPVEREGESRLLLIC